MRKFFYQILAVFIRNPQKRRQFRQNHYIRHPKCEMEHRLNRMMQTNISTAYMHQKTFAPFKAKHMGQDVVLYATGPSAKDYQPIKDAIHIGVNKAFASCPVTLDYYFVQDYAAAAINYMEEINSYHPEKCQKFYGLAIEYDFKDAITIPESDAIKAGALRYRTDLSTVPYQKCKFAYDIANQPLGDFYSVVFSALQFALWTYPKRIYLVGCDCSSGGHVTNAKAKSTNADRLVPYYKELKLFASKYYPDIEIVSINPVGLKGIFKDEYQK